MRAQEAITLPDHKGRPIHRGQPNCEACTLGHLFKLLNRTLIVYFWLWECGHQQNVVPI